MSDKGLIHKTNVQCDTKIGLFQIQFQKMLSQRTNY